MRGLIPVRIEAGVLTHTSQDALARLSRVLINRLKHMAEEATQEISTRLRKAEKYSSYVVSITKADRYETIADTVMARLQKDFVAVSEEALPALETAAMSGLTQGIVQIDVSDTAMITKANTTAKAWARERAAEMVGMQRDQEGNLFTNANARWAITTTTRDDVRCVVEKAFEQESTRSEIRTMVQQAGTFSEYRANLIARTEVSRAQAFGNFRMWKESGIVKTVDWLAGEEACDDCAALEDGGPYDMEDTPMPIDDSHPQCSCNLSAAEMEE